MFQKWLQFVKAHDGIIIAVIVFIAFWVVESRFLAYRDRQDATTAQTAHEKFLVDQNTASVKEEQIQTLEKTVSQQTTEIRSLRQEVMNAIEKRNTDAQVHEAAEATDPLQSVASRWVTLIKGSDSDVRVGTDGNVSVIPSAARLTTEALERGQAAEGNYQDLSKLDSKKDQQIEGLNNLIVSERDSAKQEILVAQDQAVSCKAEQKAAQDQASKRSRKSFWKGVATGAGAVAVIVLRFI